ncbi:cytochrome c biogenesis protein CcsA [Mangrovibacterium lignilyticum]|uniref:cytochrome c biogenesis protein CcsA n=1 Tax=Mangrovibacterium lignilyticum TaxID=2668052 RepID=UPI001967C011|nr:cytochrome c biogenesis protein CcsA [Mangrovibacterium lignilyticum]
MMKKLSAVLFSMITTSCLLVVFAIAIAYATFIENDYGTQTAQILIYGATWFEVLLGLTGINLIGGMFYYKAFKLKRWSMVLFHLAFIIMLVGAGITRFYSYEGNMHIREGESSNQVVTTQSYIQLEAKSSTGESVNEDWPVSLSPYTYAGFEKSVDVGDQELELEIVDFVPNGVQSVVADETGLPTIEFIVLDKGVRKNVTLSQSESAYFDNFTVSFEDEVPGTSILIKRSGPELVIIPSDTLKVIKMTGEYVEPFLPGKEYALTTQNMFQVGEDMFVLRSYQARGRKVLTSAEGNNGGSMLDGVLMNVKMGEQSHQVVVFGKKGTESDPVIGSINGIQYKIQYGAKIIELPFALRLNEFQLERYPGSMSPSSFASEVTLVDRSNDLEKPFRIYMNNILDYGGYRFFQSSYDTDEKGTVLSVSFDRLGTMVTYLGYLLMAIGMVFSFFNKKSRFQFLLRSASRVKELKRKHLTLLLLLFLSFPVFVGAQAADVKIDQKHVSAFDKLLVQDRKGRIEPVNTLASEVLRKLTRKNSYSGLSATEVFMGMSAMPNAWKNEPLIKVSNSELASKLGVKGPFASFNQLVDLRQGSYKLRALVDEAYQKQPNSRNKFDKEVINVDERVNICFQIYNGGFLRVFPDRDDTNQTWLTETDYYKGARANPAAEDLLMTSYLGNLQVGMLSGDFTEATKSLQKIVDFQHEHGSELILPTSKVKLEILYNNLNIFGWLSKVCALLGLGLLIVHLLAVFSPKLNLKGILVIGNWLVVLVFVLYSSGLAIRWYISGHAPWSNSYETLLYIGWATLLSGFVFLKKSQITLAVTSILTALILMVAGMSWLNPEITNLVPVLKSYWLIIHVAVITASYGFLGIAALLGMLNLIFMTFRTNKNRMKISFTIVEIAIVIELALIVGLVLLTIGAFIGGVWANESWGRYWGWDPKETWALVTILVYSFIIHLRKVPGLYSHYVLSFLALVGFSSVLMTFFGVNYYLSGMHSYAQGDPPPVPSGIYIAVAVILVLGVFAAISEKKYGQAEKVINLEE